MDVKKILKVAGIFALSCLIEKLSKKGKKDENNDIDDVIDDTVFCNVCDISRMVKIGPNKWVCPKCGNEAFLEDPDDMDTIYFERNPEDDYDDMYDDIPEGCMACGGDYPNCVDSCNLMSD